MTSKMTAWLVSVFIFMFAALAGPSDASAGDAFRKLGRGVANIAGGWLELYHQIEITTKEDGPLAGATTGMVKGIFKTIYRTLIGAYETATFFVPIPSDYEPILYPEYVPITSGYTTPERKN